VQTGDVQTGDVSPRTRHEHVAPGTSHVARRTSHVAL
jgi:hypothetical protein